MSEAIKLPDLGSGMAEATLLNWVKKVGDSIRKGDVIAEVETDKATVEVPAEVEGTITQLVGELGATIAVGAVIGYVGAAGEAPPASNGAASNGGGTPVAATKEIAPPDAETPTPPSAPRQLTPDASGVKVPSDNQNNQGSAPPDNKTNQAPTGTAPQNSAGQAPPATAVPSSEQDANRLGTETPDDADGNLPGGVKASPIARNMAIERGIDLRQVRGTGPGGRIVKADVEGYQAPAAQAPAPASQDEGNTAQAAAPAPTQAAPAAAGIPAPNYATLPSGPDVEIIDVTRIRTRIASRMVESKQQVPHFYVTSEIDTEALIALRKQVNANLDDDHKVTVNDMIVKAVALTLVQFPNLNTHFYGDKLARYKRINIGIAVAMPNGGLMNVVAKDADRVSLGTMAANNKAMIGRAREGKVKPDDVQGSTFTVSNLGGFDVEHFLAIINPPEAGILAVASAGKVPVVKADGTVGVGDRMKVTLSVDHRVSDGAEGAQFLQAFKKLIENPMTLLL